MGNVCKLESKVAGYYKIEAIKVDDDGNEISRRVAADWFPNLITDGGLNRMGNTGDWLAYCQVGSGSTTPAYTDTTLSSRIASQSGSTFTMDTEVASPYYVWHKTVYTFGVGVAAGNISEIGVGWASTGGLFSRALILDDLGSPTTITVLSDEVLNITYEVRVYPKLTDTTGTCVFTGAIGGSYDWIMRSAKCGDAWDWQINPDLGTTFAGYGYGGIVYDGVIGGVTSLPSGNSSWDFGYGGIAYVDLSLERKFLYSFSTAQGNLAGGIRSLYVRMGVGTYQFQFTPPIPKTSADSLTFTVSHSWARA